MQCLNHGRNSHGKFCLISIVQFLTSISINNNKIDLLICPQTQFKNWKLTYFNSLIKETGTKSG